MAVRSATSVQLEDYQTLKTFFEHSRADGATEKLAEALCNQEFRDTPRTPAITKLKNAVHRTIRSPHSDLADSRIFFGEVLEASRLTSLLMNAATAQDSLPEEDLPTVTPRALSPLNVSASAGSSPVSSPKQASSPENLPSGVEESEVSPQTLSPKAIPLPIETSKEKAPTAPSKRTATCECILC